MQSPNPYAGQVNLPDDGQIQISNPDSSSGSTPPVTAAQPTPPPQAPPPQQAPQPNQNYAQAPNAQQPQANQPKVDLSKAPQQAPQAPVQAQQSPQVQRASMVNSVAQALAGGPRYSYTYSSDGTLQKTQVPVSTAHLGMAIALEALQGAATGFAHGQGPAGKANAVGASFTQGQQQANQQNNQAKQQAQVDFAQRAQQTESNFRMWQAARVQGREDLKSNTDYVASFAPTLDLLQKGFAGHVIASGQTYDQLKNHNITTQGAIPDGVQPRIDPNTGEPMKGPQGQDLYDLTYTIVDPKDLKASGLLSPEAQATLAKYGVNGNQFDNPMLQSIPMQARMALGLTSQAASLNSAEKVFSGIFSNIDEAGKTNGSQVSSTDVTKPNALTPAPIKDPKISDTVNTAAKTAASTVGQYIDPSNFQALSSGLVMQESSGDPSKISPTGAKGLYQLTTPIQQKYKVTDPLNPQQNATAGNQYIADLIKQHDGNVRDAIADYYSGPSSIDKNGQIVASGTPGTPGYHTAKMTSDYVNQVSARVGFQAASPVGPMNDNPDLSAYTKSHPGMVPAIEKFVGAYNAADGKVSVAIAHMQQSDPASAGLISNYLLQKNDKAVQINDQFVTDQAENSHVASLTQGQEDRATFKAKQADQAKQTELAKQGPLIDAIGTGKVPLSSLSYIATRNPDLLEKVTEKYPEFDGSKINSYVKTYADFTSGKTSKQINNGATALLHMQELEKLNTVESHIPGRPDYNAYMNKADTLSLELAGFYGSSTLPEIAAIKKSLTATLPGQRQAAISTQAASMSDKFDSLQQTWDNAAPSDKYQAPMPGISPAAQQARAALDPRYKQRIQQNQQQAKQQVPPNGTKGVKNAQGNYIGYIGQNGQYVQFGQQ